MADEYIQRCSMMATQLTRHARCASQLIGLDCAHAWGCVTGKGPIRAALDLDRMVSEPAPMPKDFAPVRVVAP